MHLRILIDNNVTDNQENKMVKERTKSSDQIDEQLSDKREIILYNDNVNTFDFVIETLIEVCEHDPITAEQCTLIAHYNGKCPVKSGDLDDLIPLTKEMTNRGLTVSIK
ncbi:MAG TPA: ATP-dependent Clp protease adaptor ClpS [Bacteroidales bacterium]|nr:ATP-dependent Clp protease adaptor ClpS [Bacteroidales bacterium]HPR57999.1 ATP-dependent Clp protease adaptor ClpS [Bacteroidales bacterium]HRW96638.1 ATP-dependent Clp protease adaptor ClpS [Bacteroidales bacterium]